jgi:hypothetical protein
MDTIIAVLRRDSFNLYITLINIVKSKFNFVYGANPYPSQGFGVK